MTTVHYYDTNAEQFFRETVDVNMEALYAAFLAHVPKGGHILDAGCGSGRDSHYFSKQGYIVTAFDASQKLVALSTRLTGLPVLHLKFQELNFVKVFDGIWACASLLHVPRAEIDDALRRLTKALRPGGVLYASFKYGNSEWEKDGRFFNSYDEESFYALISKHHHLTVDREWKSADVRRGRKEEFWYNVLLKRL